MKSDSCFLRLVVISVLFVLVGTLLYLGLRAVGAYLVTGDEVEEVDAIVLLAGGDDLRMEEAVQLYQDRYAHFIVLTETGEAVEQYGVDYIEIVRQELLKQHIPPTAILQTERAADSTLTEARRVRTLLENRGMKSAVIVTDPWHTRRTKMIYQEMFSESQIKIVVRPIRSHWYRSDRWFFSLDGWRVTFLELGKLFGHLIGIRSP